MLATGLSGMPRVPDLPGAELFRGDGPIHSSAYQGGEAHACAGKACVVLGANTSAHDICADLWEQGAASVTMVICHYVTIYDCMNHPCLVRFCKSISPSLPAMTGPAVADDGGESLNVDRRGPRRPVRIVALRSYVCVNL